MVSDRITKDIEKGRAASEAATQRRNAITQPPASQIPHKPKVVPHHSGYAPGVDPKNLKDILYEEDIERYRRTSAQ